MYKNQQKIKFLVSIIQYTSKDRIFIYYLK